jgi:hypothetical protein
VSAALVHARAGWQRLRGVELYAALLAMTLLPGLVAVIGAARGRFGGGLFDEALNMDLRLLLPLGPLLLMGQVVSEQVEAGTQVYLLGRPAPASALLVGRALLTVALLLPPLLGGLALVYALAFVRAPAEAAAALPHVLACAGSLCVGLGAYLGVAAALGVVFARRALLAAFLYLLLVEELMSNLPGALKILTVSFYVRSGCGLTAWSPGAWEPTLGPAGALAIATVWGATWFAIAAWLINHVEFRETDS